MKNWAERWAEDWTGSDRRCGTCRWHKSHSWKCLQTESSQYDCFCPMPDDLEEEIPGQYWMKDYDSEEEK